MSDSEALQKTTDGKAPTKQTGIANSVSEIKEVATIMAKSGFFDDAKSASQAAVKIMAGRELGIPEMAAMRGVYVANGNTQLSGPLLAALIKRSEKYDYRAVQTTSERAEITFFENGDEAGTASFSMDEAINAGLVKEDSAWDSYPSDMLFWRALSRGKRRYCPEIGWGATYVWGEGDGKVEEIRNQTGADDLPAKKVEDANVVEEDTTDAPENDSSKPDGDGLPFDKDAGITPDTNSTLHAVGQDVYGDKWDEKRSQLVKWATDERTDSAADLTENEAQKIISGMRSKNEDDRPEMVTDA